MTAFGVRREKAALSSGCKSHPATAPAGSNRSSYGGNEVAEGQLVPRDVRRAEGSSSAVKYVCPACVVLSIQLSPHRHGTILPKMAQRFAETISKLKTL